MFSANSPNQRNFAACFFLYVVVIIGVMCPPTLASDYTVAFDKPEYVIHAQDEYTVNVHIDPVPATGLYSVGVKVTFPQENATVLEESDIVLPAELNSDGWGGAPDKSTGDGYAGAAGAVVQLQPYNDSLVLSVQLTDLTAEGVDFDSYTLGLEFYYTSQVNFVDFTISELDSLIAFTTASVNVTVKGDFDGDHHVNLDDFDVLGTNWLDTACGECSGADLTDDGVVGIADLLIIAENWLLGNSE